MMIDFNKLNQEFSHERFIEIHFFFTIQNKFLICKSIKTNHLFDLTYL